MNIQLKKKNGLWVLNYMDYPKQRKGDEYYHVSDTIEYYLLLGLESFPSPIVSQQHLRRIVFFQGNLNWKDASENLRQIIVMKPLS